MKTFLSKIIVFSAAAFVFTQPSRAADQPVLIPAAVLNFQTAGEKLANKGTDAAVLLNATLSASPNLILVERQELDKIIGEQELGLSGAVTVDSATKLGNLTGAKVLVTGRLFESGDKFFLVSKIMSTETGRVYGEVVTFPDLRALDKATTELAGKIEKAIEQRADTLVAKTETPEERVLRFKKLMEGKKKPSIAVTVREQHISRASIDPAVQTEMKLVFEQIGFEVIESSSSTTPADITISGEAFSELGSRRGNLVSCRARVEIQVKAQPTGKLLLTDRQTDVGIDLAENVAGKSALENASVKLIERILRRLASE